jgi:hypothetical protein
MEEMPQRTAQYKFDILAGSRKNYTLKFVLRQLDPRQQLC